MDRGIQTATVQKKEAFHARMSHAFVSIDKGMVANERMRERSRFARKVRIEIVTREGHAWLSDGAFRSIEVTNARAAAAHVHDSCVYV